MRRPGINLCCENLPRGNSAPHFFLTTAHTTEVIGQSVYRRECAEMDINGISGEGLSSSNGLPLGFGMNLRLNEAAMQGYAGLTESEKEHLIMKCRDARSRNEMQRIVDDLAPGTDVQAIMDEEKDNRIF